jgi:broad specificity phosphatase PhoE
MILIARHGATSKNKFGGADNSATPLLPEGEQQARDMGGSLYLHLLRNHIQAVDVITSGYVRTEMTAKLALEEVNRRACIPTGSPRIRVGQWTQDGRLGEISFAPKDSPPTLGNPGFFGRNILGETREDVLARLTGFYDDHLAYPVEKGRALLILAHRASTQILMENVLGVSTPSLGKKNNCELWRIDGEYLEVLHQGIKADRDSEDERRASYMQGKVQVGFLRPVATHQKPF